MPVTRRSFLRSGATAALTTAVALKAAPMAFAQIGAKPDPTRDVPIPYEARQSPLVSFKRETFEPYVGGIFRVRADCWCRPGPTGVTSQGSYCSACSRPRCRCSLHCRS